MKKNVSVLKGIFLLALFTCISFFVSYFLFKKNYPNSAQNNFWFLQSFSVLLAVLFTISQKFIESINIKKVKLAEYNNILENIHFEFSKNIPHLKTVRLINDCIEEKFNEKYNLNIREILYKKDCLTFLKEEFNGNFIGKKSEEESKAIIQECTDFSKVDIADNHLKMLYLSLFDVDKAEQYNEIMELRNRDFLVNRISKLYNERKVVLINELEFLSMKIVNILKKEKKDYINKEKFISLKKDFIELVICLYPTITVNKSKNDTPNIKTLYNYWKDKENKSIKFYNE